MARRVGTLGLILALSCSAIFSAARGDIVRLKDGYTIQGKLSREMELIQDPVTGQVIPIVKANNCFLISDRVRYVIFGLKQVAGSPIESTGDGKAGLLDFKKPLRVPPRNKLPAVGRIHPATQFNSNWERTVPIDLDVQGVTTRFKLKQQVTLLTPVVARVQSQTYEWELNFFTNELGPAVVLPMLRTHPDVAGRSGGKPEFEGQFKVYRFCAQAGWLPEAKAELMRLKGEFPGEGKRFAEAETALRDMEMQALWEEISKAAKAGRHAYVREALDRISLTDLPGPLQISAANLKSKYDAAYLNVDSTAQLLRGLADNAGESLDPIVAAAVREILGQLGDDTVDRLEAFAPLARQAEHARQSGAASKHSTEQLLALALTAWVMGPAGADPSPEAARRLWVLRDNLRRHQLTNLPSDRAKLRAEIADHSKMSVVEVARVLSQLPPAEPLDVWDPRWSREMERKTQVPTARHGSFAYRVQLPAEYTPARSYPLLLVLPNAEQSTSDAMSPWSAEALRRGYILASVDWGTVKNRYEFSESEHAAVLDTIRDLKRLVQVDPDRVFLTGFAEGGTMAIDVGLSHPDLFAGVAPINGRPRGLADDWYRRNAQNLPFYLTLGELSGPVRSWCASIYDNWVNKGYNSLMVQYRGRTLEFFPGEIPYIFEWFELKRRSLGFPDLGRHPNGGSSGEEFQIARATDDRYYWASTDSVNEKCLTTDFFRKSVPTPAWVQASIREGNQVQVFTRGLKQLSLWFGRANDGEAGVREMIDFTKPVKITVNGHAPWTNNNKPLTPSLETLLEDYYFRADRSRLFFARVDFDRP